MIYAWSIDMLARENETHFSEDIDISRLSIVAKGSLIQVGIRLFTGMNLAFIAARKWLKAWIRRQTF